jgi:hypothetical protein
MDTENWKHPKAGELYTPVTPEVIAVIQATKRKCGTWETMAYHTKTRSRIFRRYLKGYHKAISLTMMDRLLVTLGEGNLDDFLWFTPEDLIELGIWKETHYGYYRNGRRVSVLKSTGEEIPGMTPAERKARKKAKRKEKKRKLLEKQKREQRWMERYGWRRS